MVDLRFGTEDADWRITQKEGNGAIAGLLSGGRSFCDGGQAVKARKDTAQRGAPTI